MKRRLLNALLFLLLLAACGVAAWCLSQRDRTFRGKPESEWIKGITYYPGNSTQADQWRSFGPEGMRVLARGLDKCRLYRRIYRSLMPKPPARLNRILYPLLPDPFKSDARTRIASLLSELGQDAKLAEPAIARLLNDDDPWLRQAALACYWKLLDAMNEKEKAARLPAFLHALQDTDPSVRSQAAVLLWHYRSQAQTVAPTLAKALRDPVFDVQLNAARALVHIDPAAALNAGVIPFAIQTLNDPNQQFGFRGAELLGEMAREPVSTVPALIEATRSTNVLVVVAAMKALVKFPEQKQTITPTLLKIASDHELMEMRRVATAILRKFDPAAADDAGLQ